MFTNIQKIACPLAGQKVYKDECVYSFDTPDCENGLYICMSTFVGVGKKMVEAYSRRTNNNIFLHMRRIKKEIPATEEDAPKPAPTKLAIGVEGGFDTNDKKYEIEEINSVVVLPEWAIHPLPNADLPAEIQISAAMIIGADSAAKQAEAAALSGQWDGEKRVVSKHAANLTQLDNGIKIGPTCWKCEKCDKTENLWLNLTDGTILCGRRFWDGSGGNNHALEHYAVAKYPLAVKLGTITPDGGDVYSYDEDDMVEDPNLAQHLAHFGIDVMQMKKTDKTMVELEIDANQKILEWNVITEAGSKLQPVYGPGYTGIQNLGNSCYMNSVMQVIFTIPDFIVKYKDPAEAVFEQTKGNLAENFDVQMAKFAVGLLSGDYSKPTSDPAPQDPKAPVIKYPEGIRPQMFKTLIGKDHAEFSTKRQQDAQEFLLHLISTVERHCVNSPSPTSSIKFEVEERIECTTSHQVKYTQRCDYLLALPIPLEAATNKEAVAAYEDKAIQMQAEGKHVDPKDVVRPRIKLQSCLDTFAASEAIEGFFSSAINANTTAKKTTRLSTFPDYLMIQMKKFTIGSDWVPKKLDVSLDMPDELDIANLRGKGVQPGEELLPEVAAAQPAEVQLDQAMVSQLVDMGFAIEGCKKAVFHNQSLGIEAAMNWVMEHMGDPDFAAPFRAPGSKSSQDTFVANEEALAMIMSMGFSLEQAKKALKATDNNTERAIDWIFSHAGETDQAMDTDQGQAAAPASTYRDGSGKYQLVAFISHMGTSTMVGHYVCHILREGRWVIFNDEKVALSENPPKDLAYIYLYKRL